MNKTKIINIIGASGSGKTSAAQIIEQISSYNIIKSYVTRAPRYKDEWGHTFLNDEWERNGSFFINKLDPTTFISHDEMIAYFYGYKKNEHYFATKNQVDCNNINFYIVDVDGAKQVKNRYKNNADVLVSTIYLQVDETNRWKRLYKRAKNHDFDGTIALTYEEDQEIHNRLNKDKDLFIGVECDYVIQGNDISVEEVAELMISYAERIEE